MHQTISGEVYQATADLLAGLTLNGTNPNTVEFAFRRLLQVLAATPQADRGARLNGMLDADLLFSREEHDAFMGNVARRRPGASKHVAAADGSPTMPDGILPDPLPSSFGDWIDDYLAYAGQVAPMTPELFHISSALWLISVVVARRLCLPLAYETLYPNLFMAWVAPTTLYHKTSGLNVARFMARKHFGFLLAPEEVTHESFLSDLAGMAPSNLDTLDERQQARWRLSRDFAAQRGTCIDEMSGLLASAGKEYNQGLIECFLRLYDCDEEYRRSTHGRGYISIRNAYCSILGSSTPRGMATHLQSDRLWDMGWWPRWAILTPEAEPVYAKSQFVTEPPGIADSLLALHNLLPRPAFEEQTRPVTMLVEREVFAHADRVSEIVGHRMPAREIADQRLYGLYGRLPTQAMKVAMLVAGIEWAICGGGDLRLRMDHYGVGLAVAERWRHSAHRAVAMARATDNRELQDHVLRLVLQAAPRGATLREMSRALPSRDRKTILDSVRALVDAGEVEESHSQETPSGGRPTTRYVGVTE